MKRKIIKGKYKFGTGVQTIQNDTPDYSSAYKLKAEENAKNQVGQNLAKTGLDIAGTAIGVPGLGGIAQGASQISDAAFKDAKGNYKNKVSELLANQFNPLETAGKGLSAATGFLSGNFKNNTAAADLFSGSLIGTGLGALGMKNPFGKTTQEKVKEDAQKAEEATRIANINKRYSEGSATDAQSFLAKKGKYKVKSKQPRMIETEGREPIFSPKKPDGTRDLLYYNPNDPTHEEGGVKAVVMPRAQMGKRKTKAATVPTYIKPLPNLYQMEQDKRMSSNKAAGRKGLEYTFDENPYAEDAALEEGLSIIDPTGATNWDNVARSYKNYKESQGTFDKTVAGIGLGVDAFSAIPFIGKTTVPFKMTRWALSKGLSKLPKGERLAKAIYQTAEKEALPAAKGLWQKTKRFGKNVFQKGTEAWDEFNDLDKALKIEHELSGKEIDKKSDKTIGDLVSGKAYGAKQLKVNDLNNAALSQNLTGMPSPNAANKFILPAAGKSQVARQIPEDRRHENKKTKRSHKKSSGPIKTVEPPMLYEMKPPPPRSTFNTKNDFKDGTKSLNSEKERKADSTRYAQNVYSAAKRMQLANDGKGKFLYVTEKRKGHKNYGFKTGNNTCISAACYLNKMTGTNLPLNPELLTNPFAPGDNAPETRRNLDFKLNHKKLGFKELKPNEKMQPGDILQFNNRQNTPAHANTFLGNAQGPMIGVDHGDDDNEGYQVEHFAYKPKYITAKDALKDNYATVYRYMGLPKKKMGSKSVTVYQDGTEAAATYKHTKTFKSKPAYQEALQAHDDSLNLYGQSRYFTDLVKGSNLYQSTIENPPVKNITRTGSGKTSSPTKTFGSPDDASEDVMSIAGINPMRKDLYSRKESKYKSFKEYEEAKASGQNNDKHEGYEINMYKHPEMALRYEPDTTSPMQIRKPKLNITRDTSTVRQPKLSINTSDTTSKQNKEVVILNKPRGKFVGREKTFLEKVGEKAGEFIDKVGSSTRMSNGKKLKVYK